jgi:hypothetical protein
VVGRDMLTGGGDVHGLAPEAGWPPPTCPV